MAAVQPDRRKAPRPDDPEHRGRRSNPRAHVILPATVDALSGRQTIRLLDISCEGARLQGTGLPANGKEVILKCGSVDAFGTIVWAVEGRCGVHFDEPLGLAELAALRDIAVAAERSGVTTEEQQAIADWENGLAR